MNHPVSQVSLALLTALLAACGGTPSSTEARAEDGRATVASAFAASLPVPPLIADDGSLMPSMPQAVPSDAGARTRTGRYATAAQAAQLEASIGGSLVRVAVKGSGAAAVDEAAGLVYAMLAGLQLPDDAPVLIEGADLRSAAALVDRLAAHGVRNTWLVTQ